MFLQEPITPELAGIDSSTQECSVVLGFTACPLRGRPEKIVSKWYASTTKNLNSCSLQCMSLQWDRVLTSDISGFLQFTSCHISHKLEIKCFLLGWASHLKFVLFNTGLLGGLSIRKWSISFSLHTFIKK